MKICAKVTKLMERWWGFQPTCINKSIVSIIIGVYLMNLGRVGITVTEVAPNIRDSCVENSSESKSTQTT